MTGTEATEAGLRTVGTGVTYPIPSYHVPEGAGCGVELGSHWQDGPRGPSSQPPGAPPVPSSNGASSRLLGAGSLGRGDRELSRRLQPGEMEAVLGRGRGAGGLGTNLGTNLGTDGLIVGLQNMTRVCNLMPPYFFANILPTVPVPPPHTHSHTHIQTPIQALLIKQVPISSSSVPPRHPFLPVDVFPLPPTQTSASLWPQPGWPPAVRSPTVGSPSLALGPLCSSLCPAGAGGCPPFHGVLPNYY